ncbi:beta-L-arabinofuranosidase domain-containing protein [Sphingobacterium sp. FBM7-1]|uniref:glycoside hydrolase family 127 protein n=1 Tax=Sphingobacterium sp. FBM7-1 TaxID=2886688 RepID=UPI001D11B73F|nr:beta-L-arabinofuranosidase domain-containing protein [Sphingobacterium sp. FBM7-1]MCC2597859.1 glycoside hydrolase family 127 protein [Sphingobacterium sp. FBM7-1]
MMIRKKIIWSLYFMAGIAGTQLSAQEKLYSNAFELNDVRLLDSPFKHATDLNTEILLQYDVDRLLAPFLKQAGLPAKAESFPNWVDLDGHVGGHYLSALAIHYATTGNPELKKRMDYFLSELKRCQETFGDGYVGGVPGGETLWKDLREGNPHVVWNYWVPWYNLHKTYAGLRDAWAYGKVEDAKQMFLDLCDWGITLVSSLNDEQMEAMLANEFGGMNEVYADAYHITGDEKYLVAAKRFAHKEIFESMATEIDNLDNKHANTQVPKAVGYQRVAELSGDAEYITASEYFWDRVANHRSLSLGGNSRREHFPSVADAISYTEEKEGPETCNTNNMLKLTEGLFRMNPEARYADFYERALYNHILSSQHPEHGGYVYFTSARPRHYRVYSAPNEAMWCCVGTGMENHGKYGEFIYSHHQDSLYVNLFIASELEWKEKDVVITQQTTFPEEEGSKLTIQVDKPTSFKLMVRHPGWVAGDEMQVICNGENYAIGSSSSSYVVVDRVWNDGDIVEIKTPMKNTIVEMPNVPSYISVLRGPILLAAKTGTEDLHGLVAGDDRWAHIAAGKLLPLDEAPFSIGSREEIQAKLDHMQAVPGKSLTYTVPGLFEQEQYKNLVFEPFYRIHDSRYLMYWLSMTGEEYEEYRAELTRRERENIELERRTIDVVTPGEQQPEVDHQMKSKNSGSGHAYGEGYREAHGADGFFSYNLLTKGNTDLHLLVRYWGNEGGKRTFDILIDGELLVTENISERWKKEEFVNVEYKVPEKLLKNKDAITVEFRGNTENVAGGVYKVRLVTSPASMQDSENPII